MSINFAQVKAITIPEGNVKSIASGSTILWKKAVAPQHTTYRLLDYIKFSGNEYILTDHRPTNNRYYYLTFDLATWSNDKFIFAANGDPTTDGAMRFTLRTSASRLQSRYGRNSSGNTNVGPSSLTADTQYQLRFRCFEDFRLYSAIANSSGTVLGYYNHDAVTFNPANMNYLAIMGYNLGSSVVSFSQGKVYRYYYRIGDAAGELGCNAYPVQRKSDGVCGLYDTITNTFYPMQGTAITYQAAGNTVTEEWVYGGYPSEPYKAIVHSYDWSYGFQNKYWYTNNKAFWNLINTYAGEATQVTVKLTVNVYNSTDQVTHTSEKTNKLTLQQNGDWKNSGFNISIQYAENSSVTANTLNCTNNGSGSTYGNIIFSSGLGVVADAGCTIGDISLEFIS